MEENTMRRDESISDVLARATDRNPQENTTNERKGNPIERDEAERSSQSESEDKTELSTDKSQQNGSNKSGSSKYSSTPNIKKCDTDEDRIQKAAPRSRKKMSAHSRTEAENETGDGQFDPSDPDSVIHMLETCDLTEEDTETLLQEAYSMNRKLKEMLRRQEDEEQAEKANTTKNQKPKPKTKSSQNGSAASSSPNSRVNSSFGSRKILPPISGEANVYALKLKRSSTQVPESKLIVVDAPRSRSTKPASSKVIKGLFASFNAFYLLTLIIITWYSNHSCYKKCI